MLYMLLICTIVGARLGHCLFYQPVYYLGSWQGFWEIFMPWKGGLASHGGTIAILLGIWWYAHKYGRKNDFDYVWVLDHLVIPVAFAACFIRLGNLFNSEIYGGPTDLPWGFVFQRNGETVPCHPTQLYEAGTYLLLGLCLMWLYWNKLEKMYRGTFVGIFLIVCFGSRFLIEFVKNDQVDFEADMLLNMGQILSIPFILLGIGFLVYAFVKRLPAQAVHK
jgi:prolipoprotein diacylglyceryl transferase